MILDDIKHIKLHVEYAHQSSNGDFEELWKISIKNIYPIDERNKYIPQIADLFWILCINYKRRADDFGYVNEIKLFIDYLNQHLNQYTPEFYTEKENVFVSFLHELLHREEAFDRNQRYDFVEFYSNIYDFLEKIKWLFALKKDDGKNLFPIRKLIEDVANTFKCDQEHYLQLVFSLEIFNKVELEVDNDSIKEKMLRIAEEYNIKLIRLLCNGGTVLYDKNASINSSSNGTIIVQSEKTVLIRNTSESYFDDSIGDIIEKYNGSKSIEGKDESDPIAYYYEYDFSNEEKLVSFEKVLTEYSPSCRFDVISTILENQYYNVFLGDSFWINNNNNMYSKMLNPFLFRDDSIIIDGNIVKGTNSFEKFINIMKNQYDEFGVTTLCERNGIDVLTLDFIVCFYDELIQNGNDFLGKLKNEYRNDDDYYQNILFRMYFENAINNGSVSEALSKYQVFIENHYPYDLITEETKFAEYNKLIMPFRPYIPYYGDAKSFYTILEEKEYKKDTELKKIKKIGTNKKKIKIYDVNEEIAIEETGFVFYDMNDVLIEEKNIIDGYCLYNKNKKEVYITSEKRDEENIISYLSKELEKGLIKPEISFPDIKRIHNICIGIGFSDFVKNFNRKIPLSISKEAIKNISLYKLLWHIQFWKLNNERYELFRKLVLEYYYTRFILNYESITNEYFDQLEKDDESNKLIIAKESSGEVSTLYDLYITNRNVNRGALSKAFDGAQIKSHFDSVNITYLNKEVDEIIFITDNIISGKSTLDMLVFYIYNKKGEKNPRTYLWDKSEIVPLILQKNPKTKIHIKTILSTPSGVDKIKNYFKNNEDNYDIEINTILSIPDNEYHWTSEVEDTILELYECDQRKRHENHRCIFRPCNMPADSILPDYVKDVSNLVGIFQRKKEN